MGTKQFSNYSDLLTFTRASAGHALRPVSYGDELVTNGDFSDGSTGWASAATSPATVTISGGKATIVSPSGESAYMTQTILQRGKLYTISADVTIRSGAIKFQLGTSSSSTYVISTSGTHTANLVVGGTDNVFYIARSGACDADIDNVSVKEVTFDESDGTLTLFEHPDNIPRVEYDADGNRLGLLVEEARTNEIPFSQKFDDATWAKGGSISVTDNVVTAPDGTQTGCLVTAADDTTDYVVRSSVTSNGQTKSIWARTVSGTGKIGLLGHNSNSAAMFDLTETWQRFDLPVDTSETGGSNFYAVDFRGSATLTEVYIWGAQLETGSFPTSYIKTTGSTATRSADVASIPVADFGFNADAGTFVLDASWAGNTTDVSAIVHLGDASDRHLVYYNNGNYRYQVKSANTVTVQAVATGAEENDVVAASYKKDSYFFGDGSAISSDTSGALPAEVLTTLDIGGYSSDNHFNGHIKSIKYYPRQLTSAQLGDLV